MVRSGVEIFNPRTGQRTIFLKTAADAGGAYLRNESFHPPRAAEPEHVHPFHESPCGMLSGTLHFHIAGSERIITAGESIDIPRNVEYEP